MTKKFEYRTEYELCIHVISKDSYRVKNIPPITDIKHIENILKSTNMTDVYKISIFAIKKEFDPSKENKYLLSCDQILTKIGDKDSALVSKSEKEYSFLVSDEIKTAGQLYQECIEKYKIDNFAVDKENFEKPAILTHVTDHFSGFSYPRIRTFGGKNISCKILEPKKDIVVNNDLIQIYPKKTEKIPTMLEKLFRNGR